MTKAPRIKFVIFTSFVLSIGFWMAGYLLAPDPSAFVKNTSWLYQVVWLPAHVVCGYLAVCIYREALSSGHPEAVDSPVGVIPYLNYLFKKLLIATLAVMPFLVMDGIEGYEMVLEEFSSMGHSGWLLMTVWLIEWVATGVLWVHVLLTLRLTFEFYSESYVRDNLESLLIASKDSPLLLAGVENSLVILLYALATFGYIWLVGGELSDFVALGVSAVFVLAAFLGSMMHLKMKINRALDDIYESRLQHLLKAGATSSTSTAQGSHSLEDLRVIDQLVFSRPPGISLRSYARLRSIKASLLLDPESDSQSIARDMFRYTEYELRLATVGAAELRAVMLRLSAPIAGLMAKSGLVGGS